MLAIALIMFLAPLVQAYDLTLYRQSLADADRYYVAGNFTAAEQSLATAVRCAERFPPLDPRLPVALHALAFLYQQHGKYPEAVANYTRAIHLWEKIGPSQHKAMLLSVDNLIGIYIETRDYKQAKKLLDVRLPEMERSTQWEDQAVVFNLKASLAAMERRFPEAESWYRQSLDLWEQHGNQKNAATLLISLSEMCAAANRYQDALDAELRALAIFESMGSKMSPFVAQTLHGVALSLDRLNRPAEAESYYERALAASREVYGPDHFFTAEVMQHYADLLRRMKRKPEAASMAAQAQTILGRAPSRQTIDAFEMKPAWR
jgi:tetratricopeptide (TPR) repeat protein